jgi:hypothetical protein
MEFILKKKTCRDFLNNYHKEIHPILLPKIIEIGILTLKLSFNKDLFSPDELNDIIISLKQQYNLQKGKKSFTNLKNKNFKNLIEENSINNNKDIFYNTIETSNFYDSNYIIPETKSFRNKQLYNNRLENPMFNTLNRNVYPNWWWNQMEPDYLNKRKLRNNNNNQLLSKSLNLNNKKEISNKNKNKNYFSLKNKTNYKISYDKDLNVIKIETGKKRKVKGIK